MSDRSPEQPLVSVIVVNYNAGEDLIECLDALARETRLPFEAIVVDNASTDDSLASARARHPWARLIESPRNVGYGRGINLGLAAARGRFVAVLNPDVIVERNWLAPLVDFLERHPETGAVAPLILLHDRPDRINALGQNVHLTGLGFNRLLARPREQADPRPTRVGGVQGGAFAMRRDEFVRLGGMNEDYFLYHEDVELSLLVGLAGLAIYTVPRSVVTHKYDLHMTPQKLHWLERHRWMTLLAVYRPTTLVLLAPLLLLTEALMAGYCLTRGRDYVAAKLGAIRWVMSHGAERRRCRARMQRARRVPDRELVQGLRLIYDNDQFATLARQRGGWLSEALSGLLSRRAHDRVT